LLKVFWWLCRHADSCDDDLAPISSMHPDLRYLNLFVLCLYTAKYIYRNCLNTPSKL
jgi:hypothetical protein